MTRPLPILCILLALTALVAWWTDRDEFCAVFSQPS